MSEDELLILIIMGCIIAALVYLAPTFVAFNRNHKFKVLIFIANLFLGLTGIGWLVLLIFAFWTEPVKITHEFSKPVPVDIQPSSEIQKLLEIKQLKDNGVLSDDEYEKMRLNLVSKI